MTSNKRSIRESYAACERIACRQRSTFHRSFCFLPAARRRGITAVYAFARMVDDISDMPGDIPVTDRLAALTKLRADFRAALEDAHAGRGTANDPILPAVADTIACFRLTSQHFEMIIDGAEQDLKITRYADFPSLHAYCRNVASSVGMICTQLFGGRDAAALPAAEQMGIAFQLTNILRDVAEDAARGRIYLPQSDLRDAGCSETDIIHGIHSPAFVNACQKTARRAAGYYDQARMLLSMLPFSSRRAVALMASCYAAILGDIAGSGYDVFRRRTSVPGWKKAMIFARVAIRPTYATPDISAHGAAPHA